jgi:hypothetical protein
LGQAPGQSEGERGRREYIEKTKAVTSANKIYIFVSRPFHPQPLLPINVSITPTKHASFIGGIRPAGMWPQEGLNRETLDNYLEITKHGKINVWLY